MSNEQLAISNDPQTRQMKDSGVEWIGEIPAHWEILRNKNAFSCTKSIVGNESSKTQLLSLTTKGIREKDISDTAGKVPESYDTYQYVEVNDMVMCLFDLDCSAVFSGISSYNGMISPAYKVLKSKEKIVPKFADYWFKYVSDDRKFKQYSKSLRYTLVYEEFSALPVLLPPLSEQQTIAAYLDRKCTQIDTLIANQQQQIEKLKAYKQSVITETVTKGLNPDVPMKDSGVEWIGEIPEHWKLIPLSSLSKSMRNGYVGPTKNIFCETGIKYIQSLHIKEGKIDFLKHEYYVSEEWADKHPKVYTGNLLIVQTGDIGQVGEVSEEYNGCNCHALIIVDVNNESILSKFLSYYLQSAVGKELLLATKTGALLPHLNSGRIGSTIICVPTMQEQELITKVLDKKVELINELILLKQQKIEKLQQYKKSLIYEYVTGKKEVM